MAQHKRIRISPWAAVLFLLMVITDRSMLCAAVMAAAAVHECGHLLAAYLMGIPLQTMRLDLTGARLEVVGRLLSYGEEWLLCIAGPLASLFLSAAVFFLGAGHRFFLVLSTVSLLLGLLNLMPVQGFDGGRMLSAALGHFAGVRVCAGVMRISSFFCLFLIWSIAVYCLLRVGDGLSLFCFSMSLFGRFFTLAERG